MSAKDESTGRTNQIQINSDKSRLSKEEIDSMLADAEKYRDEDEKQRQRVTSRNNLESYIFNYKQAANEADGSKLSQTDKDIVINKCNEAMSWLDNNSLAETEEYEQQLQDLNKVCSPVMAKLHQTGNSQHDGTQ